MFRILKIIGPFPGHAYLTQLLRSRKPQFLHVRKLLSQLGNSNGFSCRMFLDCLDIVRHRKIDGARKGERQTICQHGLGWGFRGTKNSSVLMQRVVNPEAYVV